MDTRESFGITWPIELLNLMQESLNSENILSIEIHMKGNDYLVNQTYSTSSRREANELMNTNAFGEYNETKHSGRSTYTVVKKNRIKKGSPQ